MSARIEIRNQSDQPLDDLVVCTTKAEELTGNRQDRLVVWGDSLDPGALAHGYTDLSQPCSMRIEFNAGGGHYSIVTGVTRWRRHHGTHTIEVLDDAGFYATGFEMRDGAVTVPATATPPHHRVIQIRVGMETPLANASLTYRPEGLQGLRMGADEHSERMFWFVPWDEGGNVKLQDVQVAYGTADTGKGQTAPPSVPLGEVTPYEPDHGDHHGRPTGFNFGTLYSWDPSPALKSWFAQHPTARVPIEYSFTLARGVDIRSIDPEVELEGPDAAGGPA